MHEALIPPCEGNGVLFVAIVANNYRAPNEKIAKSYEAKAAICQGIHFRS
jgi:hypothetical protein